MYKKFIVNMYYDVYVDMYIMFQWYQSYMLLYQLQQLISSCGN